MKELKKEIYGDDYVDSGQEEPDSPEPSPTGRRGSILRAPAPTENDLKEIFEKLFAQSI